jgi:hypothetical protein
MAGQGGVVEYLGGTVEFEEDAGLTGKEELLELELHQAVVLVRVTRFPPGRPHQLRNVVARGGAP